MAGDLRELITLEQMREKQRDGARRLLRAAWAEIARLQEEAIAQPKTFSLAEVEGLLAAERDRAVALCEAIAASAKQDEKLLELGATRLAYQTRRQTAEAIAAAIRSVPPKPIGGE